MTQNNKEKEDSEIKWGSAADTIFRKSPDLNTCMLFIVNIYFLVHALEISVLYNRGSRIKIHSAQSSVSNLQAVIYFI